MDEQQKLVNRLSTHTVDATLHKPQNATEAKDGPPAPTSVSLRRAVVLIYSSFSNLLLLYTLFPSHSLHPAEQA